MLLLSPGHALLDQTPDHLRESLTLPARSTKTLLQDSRRICEQVAETAQKLDAESLSNLDFFRRAQPFSPFDLDEFVQHVENGISTLEPISGVYATTPLGDIDAILKRMRSAYQQRRRLDEVEKALADGYRNLEGLSA